MAVEGSFTGGGNDSLTNNTEKKKEWSYDSTPSIYHHGLHKENT